jgi:hypothetical protein
MYVYVHVMYVCVCGSNNNLFFCVREGQTEDRVLRRIFGHMREREAIPAGWTELHNEEICNLSFFTK